MKILLTGGAGYIGSHTAVSSVEKGHEIIIFDNLSNSYLSTISNITKILNKDVKFINADLLDFQSLDETFYKNQIDAVIHFAGYKSVENSVKNPISYYENNLQSSVNLIKAMDKNNVRRLIFSSSATVYGHPKQLPITEDHNLKPLNPYGLSKYFVELMLNSLALSNKNWSIISLRYFNPIGSHFSGLLGDKPLGDSNNLIPKILDVVNNKEKFLTIYGKNFETADGTGIRDYIHIMDIAEGHIYALENLNRIKGYDVFNMGTGKGYSVFEIMRNIEKVFNLEIPFIVSDKRVGDIASCFADVTKAKNILGWHAKRDLKQM